MDASPSVPGFQEAAVAHPASSLTPRSMRILLLAALLLSVLDPAHAVPPVDEVPPARQLTMTDALHLALADNPTVNAALSRVRTARLKLREAYIPMQPTFNVVGRYVRDLDPPPREPTTADFLSNVLGLPVAQGASSPPLDIYQGVFSMRQTVYTFQRVEWTAAAARLARKQASQEYRTSIEILLQDVQVRYVEAQLAQQSVDISHDRLAERQRFLLTSEKLFKAGEVAQYDVLQYRTSVREAERILLELQSVQAQSIASLIVLLNLPPATAIALTEPEAPLSPPPSLKDGLDAATARRPELAALRWAVQAAEANVQASARVNAPTIGLETDAQADNISPNRWNAGVVVTIPILDGGQTRNQKLQAREALYQTRQNLEAARRSAVLDVTQAYEALRFLWPQIEVAEKNVEDARRAMTMAEIRYKEVLSSSLELLQAQDALVTARDALARIRAQYRISYIGWQRATSSAYPVALPRELEGPWRDAKSDDLPDTKGPPHR